MKLNRFCFIGIQVFIAFSLIIVLSCSRAKPLELYHKFPDNQWQRFNYLSFETPVTEGGKDYNIVLFSRFNKDFNYETLDFNMILKTSEGEERIHEYQMKVKSPDGKFLGRQTGDSCQVELELKHGMRIGKPCMLKVELENLIPRMATGGILGLGIRVEGDAR